MSTRRVVIAAAAASAVTLGTLFATDTLDEALRALGARPRPLPRPEDTTLLEAVVADQQRVLAVARAADAGAVVALVSAQLEQLGATPGSITGKELAAFEVAERERWGKLIKERNITTD